MQNFEEERLLMWMHKEGRHLSDVVYKQYIIYNNYEIG